MQNGDLVQWQEGGAGQYTCTGRIVCEEKYQDGSNPFGHFYIRVDKDHWLRACHTAREMSEQCVTRSISFNRLRLKD